MVGLYDGVVKDSEEISREMQKGYTMAESVENIKNRTEEGFDNVISNRNLNLDRKQTEEEGGRKNSLESAFSDYTKEVKGEIEETFNTVEKEIESIITGKYKGNQLRIQRLGLTHIKYFEHSIQEHGFEKYGGVPEEISIIFTEKLNILKNMLT